MLDKVKRYVNISNDDIPNPTGCYNLVSAEYNSITIPPQESSALTATPCEPGKPVELNLLDNEIQIVNRCVMVESINILGMTTIGLAPAFVDDAITNNGGVINIGQIVDDDIVGNTQLVFSAC
jgi:hypothetical protein